jgi:hypothetical protein
MGRLPGWAVALTGRTVMRSPRRPAVREGSRASILGEDRRGPYERECGDPVRHVKPDDLRGSAYRSEPT